MRKYARGFTHTRIGTGGIQSALAFSRFASVHYEQRGARIAVRRRTGLPDLYSPELTIELQSVRSDSSRLRGTIQMPWASRIVAAILLTIFVGFPLVALVAPSSTDRAGTLVALALSLVLLVVLPLAVRWFRKDEERLVQFLRVCLPEMRNSRGSATG